MASNSTEIVHLATAAVGSKSDGSPRRSGKAIGPGSPEAHLAAAEAVATEVT